MAEERNIGAEILEGIRDLKAGKTGRAVNVPPVAGVREVRLPIQEPCPPSQSSTRRRRQAMARRKLSAYRAATSGRHVVSTYSMSLDTYAGPARRPLPWRGTMSSRMRLRRERRARLTRVALGKSRLSVSAGTFFRAMLR